MSKQVKSESARFDTYIAHVTESEGKRELADVVDAKAFLAMTGKTKWAADRSEYKDLVKRLTLRVRTVDGVEISIADLDKEKHADVKRTWNRVRKQVNRVLLKQYRVDNTSGGGNDGNELTAEQKKAAKLQDWVAEGKELAKEYPIEVLVTMLCGSAQTPASNG